MSHMDERFKKQKYAKLCSSKCVKKSNFISSDFGILLVGYLGRVFLHKNPRNICVAICFGFTQKIASLPRLNWYFSILTNYQRIPKLPTKSSHVYVCANVSGFFTGATSGPLKMQKVVHIYHTLPTST